jgi:hypothetical protein
MPLNFFAFFAASRDRAGGAGDGVPLLRQHFVEGVGSGGIEVGLVVHEVQGMVGGLLVADPDAKLSGIAMVVLAKAHLEAAKAWEPGANEAEMQPILQGIRHGQWRRNFFIADHGSFFHAPEGTLRVPGSAINKASM